jgi:hypothetical protein
MGFDEGLLRSQLSTERLLFETDRGVCNRYFCGRSQVSSGNFFQVRQASNSLDVDADQEARRDGNHREECETLNSRSSPAASPVEMCLAIRVVLEALAGRIPRDMGATIIRSARTAATASSSVDKSMDQMSTLPGVRAVRGPMVRSRRLEEPSVGVRL